MKITKEQIKKIIQEEIENFLDEIQLDEEDIDETYVLKPNSKPKQLGLSVPQLNLNKLKKKNQGSVFDTKRGSISPGKLKAPDFKKLKLDPKKVAKADQKAHIKHNRHWD